MSRKAKVQRTIILSDKETPYFLEIEAAQYLRMDIRTLRNHRSEKTGPAFRRHGGTLIYHEKDLDAWSKENVSSS